MMNLAETLVASLFHRRARDGQARRDLFAPIGYDRDDLRAARERQSKRS